MIELLTPGLLAAAAAVGVATVSRSSSSCSRSRDQEDSAAAWFYLEDMETMLGKLYVFDF